MDEWLTRRWGNLLNYGDKFDRMAGETCWSQARCERLLARKLKDFSPLAGGFSNANYRVQFEGGEPAVVRVARDSDTLAVETAILTLVGGHIPAPEVLESGWTEDSAWRFTGWLPGNAWIQSDPAPTVSLEIRL